MRYIKALKSAYSSFMWSLHTQSIGDAATIKELEEKIAELSGRCINGCTPPSMCNKCPYDLPK